MKVNNIIYKNVIKRLADIRESFDRGEITDKIETISYIGPLSENIEVNIDGMIDFYTNLDGNWLPTELEVTLKDLKILNDDGSYNCEVSINLWYSLNDKEASIFTTVTNIEYDEELENDIPTWASHTSDRFHSVRYQNVKEDVYEVLEKYKRYLTEKFVLALHNF